MPRLLHHNHNFSEKQKRQFTRTVAIIITGNTILRNRFLQCCFFQNTKSTPWRQDSTYVYSAQILHVTTKITETGGLMVQFISREHVKSIRNSAWFMSVTCTSMTTLCCITFIATHKHAHELHSAIFPANSLETCAINHVCDKRRIYIFNTLSMYANSKDRTIIKSTNRVPM